METPLAPDKVIEPRRTVFRAVAVAVVPEARHLDGAGWDGLERIVEGALAERPAKLRRQLRLFLRFIDWRARLRHGRAFGALDPLRRAELLARLQDSRLLLLRRGFWGLRTLVLMGYYARAEAADEIGYRARRAGWEARA